MDTGLRDASVARETDVVLANPGTGIQEISFNFMTYLENLLHSLNHLVLV